MESALPDEDAILQESHAMHNDNDYRHTQKSPLLYLFLGIAALQAILGLVLQGPPVTMILLFGVAAIMCLIAAMFGQLTITGDETELRLQYGPLPLVSKRFRYEELRAAEASCTRFIDGWGIHYIPFRGWTYNIWGFQCVLLQREGKQPIRIGTDDVEGLLAFLQSKVGRAE